MRPRGGVIHTVYIARKVDLRTYLLKRGSSYATDDHVHAFLCRSPLYCFLLSSRSAELTQSGGGDENSHERETGVLQIRASLGNLLYLMRTPENTGQLSSFLIVTSQKR